MQIPILSDKRLERIQYLIIALSCLFLAIQYFFNRAFWLDESAIALNILNRDFAGLLKPLDYGQLTPVLFLWFSKLGAILLPNTELGLRLFPLLCFIASLFIFKNISAKILQSKGSQLICLALFAFNLSYLYFSSEFKQYIVDVFVTLLIIALSTSTHASPWKKYLRMLFVYAFCILVSHVAVLIIFTVSLFQLLLQIQRKEINRPFLITHSIFAVYFIAFYLHFMYHHPLQGAMEKYWQHSFLPTDSLGSFLLFFKHKFSMIFADFFQFGKPLGALLMLLFLLGILQGFRKKNTQLLFLAILPILIHLFLSALKAYPFDLRLILYLTPLILLLIGTGFDAIIQAIPKSEKIVQFLFILPLLFLLLKLQQAKIPIQREEIKSSYSFLKTKIQAADKILVFWQSGYTYQYYKRTGSFDLANDDEEIRFDNFTKDSTALSHENNWVIFTHLDSSKEHLLLAKLGPSFQTTEMYRCTGSSVYLVKPLHPIK